MNYEQKIQNAFKEVADALALRQSLNDQISAQQRYLASLQITLQRARALYQHGAVSYLEVLDAERSLFATRQTLLDLNYARQVNEISLYTALGGGLQQYTRHTSSCMCCVCVRSPQSLTYVSSWGFTRLSPSCNSNYLEYDF